MIKKLTLGIIALVMCMGIFSQEKEPQKYVVTVADVETLIIPDVLHLDITLRATDTKNKFSFEELEDKMFSKLKSLGINVKEQLFVTLFSSSNLKKYILDENSAKKIKKFRLELNNAETAGKVVIGLSKLGIKDVIFSKIDYSKMEDLKLLIRTQAVEKAKMQAEALIKPFNVKLLEPDNISDYRYSYDDRQYEFDLKVLSKGGKNGQMEVTIEPIKLKVEVSVSFIIK